jgi:capsular exopolysaccharide synthesis family protein
MIPLAVYLIERSKPKVYQSSTLVELQDISASSLGATGGPIVTGNLDAVAQLVTTTSVADTAARLLHEPPGSLVGKVSANANQNTGFLTISARDHDPAQAATIANAFAAALANRQVAQARSEIGQQVAALQKQLADTPRSDPSQRVTLSQQIAQLQALAASSASGASIIQAATPSSSPVAPKTRRAVELALVIALLLGVGAVLVAENADRRLRAIEDIESLTGWPLLAAIPPSAFSPEHGAEPRNEEAFQMLRSALTYFNVERPLGSVVIVSPQVSAGKTTVAAGLALATARAGKRAILVDADLRRPQVCARLGVPDKPGLGAVLAGERQLEEVLVAYPADSPDGGKLLVLGAGPPPPNPAALLGSQQMRALVRKLEGQADLVIVDSVAALAVSDALPLLQAVSGTVVVVRMDRTSRASVRRLQKMIASAHGTVLGAVATGSGAVGRGYGVYPYADGHPGGPLAALRIHRPHSPAADGVSANGAAPAGEPVAPDQPSAETAQPKTTED